MAETSSEGQEVEVKDFIFKQMRKLRVFKSPPSLITARVSLVAVSNQYGLVYVAGDNTTIKAIKVETLEKVFIEVQGSLQVEEENYPSVSIDVGCPFSHIALSCDDLTLAVGFKRDTSCMLGFLDVRAFFAKTPKKMFCEVVLSEETDVRIRDIAWNPTSCDIIAVLLTNGELFMLELKGPQATVVARKQGAVTAVSWSPKGKQIVAGCKDGSLIQLTPKLDMKRDIAPPSILSERCEVIDLVWISTYHFGVVFSACDDSGDSSLILMTTPKIGPATFANFNDVYYGMGEDREACFYLKYIAEWKFFLSMYAGAYEVVTVGGGEGSWKKWVLPDAARASLPTTHDQDETYPLGLGVALNVTQPIKQDDYVLPPAPILILLSTDGVLCPFYLVNKNPDAPQVLIKPAQELVLNGERIPPVSSIEPGNTRDNNQPSNGTKLVSSTPKSNPAMAFSFRSPTQPTSNPSITNNPTLKSNLNMSFSFGSPTQPTSNPTVTNNPPLKRNPLMSFSFGPPTQPTSNPTMPSNPTPKGNPTVPFSFGLPAQPTLSFVNEDAARKEQDVKPSVTPSSIPPSDAVSTKNTSKPNNAALPSKAGRTNQPSSGSVKEANASAHLSNIAHSTIAGSSSETQASAPSALGSVLSASSAGPAMSRSVEKEPQTTTARKGSTSQTFGTDGRGPSNTTLPTRVPPNAGDGATPDKSNSSKKIAAKEDVHKSDNSSGKLQETEKTSSNLSPSKQEQFEASFQKHIHKEVEAFNKEMKELRQRVINMKKIENALEKSNRVATTQKAMRETCFVGEINTHVKGLNDEVHELKSEVLEAFELLEDAKIRDGRGVETSYLHLLKGRGLDPGSQRKMNDIRSSYSRLDNALREVNMSLDEKWEKENKQSRSLKTPSLEFIYQTMRQNQKITRNQSAQLEAISRHVHKRSTWNARGGQSLLGDSEDVVSLSERLRNQKLHSIMSTSASVPARKQSELRSMLSKRSSIPVRKTTFISDWRSRGHSFSGSSTSNEETDTFSVRNIENEEKKAFREEKAEKKDVVERASMFKLPKEHSVVDKADVMVSRKQKESNAKEARPTFFSKDTIQKKPLSQERSRKEDALSFLSSFQAASSTPVIPPSVKDAPAGLSTGKLGAERTPQEAAAAAALARAGTLGPGAAIPAKTMVEYKADNSRILTSTPKDSNNEYHASLIADAALKDAEKQMRNVTQPPPSNTGTTFTVRQPSSSTSSSTASSAGPPVMVVTPGGGFPMKKPGPTPALSSTFLSSTALQTTGVSDQRQPFTSHPLSFGDKTPQSVPRTTDKLASTPRTKPSPPRVQATGAGPADDTAPSLPVAAVPSPLNPPHTSDGDGGDVAKEKVVRSLFDEEEQASIVAVRGEPEGESKQTDAVKTGTVRQAAVGKSGKDTPPLNATPTLVNVNQTPSNTAISAPGSTNPPSKPKLGGFPSTFQTTNPSIFGAGDSQTTFPSVGKFQSTQLPGTFPRFAPATTTAATALTPAASAPSTDTRITPTSSGDHDQTTTETTTSEAVTSSSTSTSQQTQRLQTLGSFNLNTQSSPLQTGTVSLPSQAQTISPRANSTVNVSATQQPSTPSATTASPIASVPNITTTPLKQPVPSSKPGFADDKKASTEAALSNVNLTPTSVATFPSPFSANSPTPFKHESSFAKSGTSSTSSTLLFGAPTNTTQLSAFQTPSATPTTTDPQAVHFASSFTASTFSTSSQSSGSVLAGGFSGLGGKPQQPNRNPFAVSPSSQANGSNLFAASGEMDETSSLFQSADKQNFGTGSSGFGGGFSSGVAATQTSGVSSMGFGGPSMTATTPLFGTSSVFGGQPSFGSTPTFGSSPGFGSNPTFGAAATFGAGAGSPAFGAGGAVFGNPGNSPERVFGSGTEPSAMFSSSSNPTFSSLSPQSAGMSSFGDLAGGGTAGVGPPSSTGFNPPMSGTSFSSYR